MPYPQLFTPLSLGSLTLKNRLVMSQMTMNYATEEGFMTDQFDPLLPGAGQGRGGTHFGGRNLLHPRRPGI